MKTHFPDHWVRRPFSEVSIPRGQFSQLVGVTDKAWLVKEHGSPFTRPGHPLHSPGLVSAVLACGTASCFRRGKLPPNDT